MTVIQYFVFSVIIVMFDLVTVCEIQEKGEMSDQPGFGPPSPVTLQMHGSIESNARLIVDNPQFNIGKPCLMVSFVTGRENSYLWRQAEHRAAFQTAVTKVQYISPGTIITVCRTPLFAAYQQRRYTDHR